MRKPWLLASLAGVLAGGGWALERVTQEMIPGHGFGLAATTMSLLALGWRGGLFTLLVNAGLQLPSVVSKQYAFSRLSVDSRIGFFAFLITGVAICWMGCAFRPTTAQVLAEAELERRVARFKLANGLTPICAWCGKVSDDAEKWMSLEEYLGKHLNINFSHGFCPSVVLPK
jgi:hypothetical protein